MYHIRKKGQSLYQKDGGVDQLFEDSDTESDDENVNLRQKYVFKALETRADHSKKKYRQELRGKGITKICNKV